MFCKFCGEKIEDGSLFCANCGSKLKRGRKVSNLLPWGMLNKHHSKSNLHRLVRSCCFPGVCLQSEPTNNQDEDLGWLIYWLEESRCHSISWRKLLFPWGGKSLVVLLLQDRLQKKTFPSAVKATEWKLHELGVFVHFIHAISQHIKQWLLLIYSNQITNIP